MSKDHDPPPLYAMVQTGLEPIAAEEITEDLGGEVKKTAPGLVVFRMAEVQRAPRFAHHGGRFSARLGHRSADLSSGRPQVDPPLDGP